MRAETLAATAVEENSDERLNQPGCEILKTHRSNEVFIALVGPAGAGAGTAAGILEYYFKAAGFESVVIKASKIIKDQVTAFNARGHSEQLELPPVEAGDRKTIESVMMMQDRGDELRSGEIYGRVQDNAIIARLSTVEIMKARANFQRQDYTGEEVKPDGGARAYIIDSLRHPAEADLLRELYRDAFFLVGVVCDPGKREQRIRKNFFPGLPRGNAEDITRRVKDFLSRDENAPEDYGQHVANTFHIADFFVDNTEDNKDLPSDYDGPKYLTAMNDPLQRFASLVMRAKIEPPTVDESAMHHAWSAQMRSSCLSRQVGAVLVNGQGNVIASGTNDVPKAGGGLYRDKVAAGEGKDERCFFRNSVYCSNNREQQSIIDDLVDKFPELTSERNREEVISVIRKTRIGGLIEFSRAVHAEMDAIISAATNGVSTLGCRLFVSTYPCHYCARHIVAAGIDEVQFIEPYPKSKATELHSDAITTSNEGWEPPSAGGSHVIFRPFVGVAPRLYHRVFMKSRDYKNAVTGDYVGPTSSIDGFVRGHHVSYSALEAELAKGLP